jgi:hypothetical protein
MSNQEIAEIKPFILAFIILLVFVLGMLYQYRQVCKSIAHTFKGTIVALLVILGIIDEKN